MKNEHNRSHYNDSPLYVVQHSKAKNSKQSEVLDTTIINRVKTIFYIETNINKYI